MIFLRIIHRNQDFALRGVYARSHRGGLAVIAPKGYDFDARVGGGELFEQRQAAIAAAVVYVYDFEGLSERRHRFKDGGIQAQQIFFFVIDRQK